MLKLILIYDYAHTTKVKITNNQSHKFTSKDDEKYSKERYTLNGEIKV